MGKNYWSCSKIADWLRGTAKPLSASREQWRLWHKKAKEKKIRYWLVEEGFDYVQDFIFWPLEKLNDVRYYIKNRYFSKSHALISNLKRGEYHEFDTRLLHCAFDELVNFVEIEEAWMHIIGFANHNIGLLRKRHRWIDGFFGWRDPQAGIARLKWAAELKFDDEWTDKNADDYGEPTPQALCAQEIFKLYTWWKDDRPKRADPMDISGLTAYYNEKERMAKEKGQKYDWFDSNENKEDEEHRQQMSALCHKIEQDFADEDTAMLIRLVNIRQGLWT